MKIRIDLLKSIRRIDKQIVVSYNLVTLKKTVKCTEFTAVPESFKQMLSDTY